MLQARWTTPVAFAALRGVLRGCGRDCNARHTARSLRRGYSASLKAVGTGKATVRHAKRKVLPLPRSWSRRIARDRRLLPHGLQLLSGPGSSGPDVAHWFLCDLR